MKGLHWMAFFFIIAEFKTLCPDGYGRVVDPSGGIVGKVI